MNLGEFRTFTAELPDDSEIVVRNYFDDEAIGIVLESVDILQRGNYKSTKNAIVCGSDMSPFCFFDDSEISKIDCARPIVFLKGGRYYSELG